MKNKTGNEIAKGRPVDTEKQAKQKQKLLDAALTLLAEKNYNNISIRELGKLAGVNSAMVSYYFDNKEGLFIALLDHMATVHFSKIQQLANSKEPIKALISAFIGLLNENPGLVHLVHTQGMSEESPFRTALINRFPKRMAIILPALIEEQKSLGIFRENVNAKYAAFSLINLIISPFIVAPIREDAWNISAEELASPEWSEHIYQLFISGITKGSSK